MDAGQIKWGGNVVAISEWIYYTPRGVDLRTSEEKHIEAMRRHYQGRIPRNVDPTGHKHRHVSEGDLPLADIIHRAPDEARIIVHSAALMLSPGEIMTALRDRKADRIIIETIEPYFQHDPSHEAGLVVLHSMALLRETKRPGAEAGVQGRFQRKFSDAVIEEIRQAKRAGRHPRDIAAQFKVSRAYVYKVTGDIPNLVRFDDYGRVKDKILSLEEELEVLALDDKSTTLLISFFAKYESEKTRALYLSDLRHFLGFIRQGREVKTLANVTEIDAISWQKKIRGTVKPRSQNRYLSSVRTIFRHMLKKNFVAENPFADLSLSKVSAREVLTKKPSLDEVRLILKEAERRRRHEPVMWKRAKLHRNEIAFRLMAAGGMRVGPICDARLSDIKERGGTSYIRLKSKGSVDHYEIPLDSDTVAHLKEYIGEWHGSSEPGHYLLFESANRPHRPVTQKILHRYLTEVVRDIKANPELTLHSFRVFAAVEWYRAGMGLRDIQQRLNHKSIEHTAKYIAIEQELPPEEFFQKLRGAI